MKIVFGEKLNNEEEILAKEISHECGVKHDTARLLLRRNVKGVKEAKEFYKDYDSTKEEGEN